MERRVGTAGWTLPKEVRATFAGDGSQLERYARRFSCVEINSSFYKPHRRSTYERWANSVPDAFRFALKIPKAISHELRLRDAEEPLARFLDETSELGVKRDVLLVGLPPKFAYEQRAVEAFFALFRARYAGRIACEPRHPSWFGAEGNAMFRAFDVARVAADPPAGHDACEPGGSASFSYWRLHGAPRIYYSAYEDTALDAFARAVVSIGNPAWCIFDNTASGAATANALAFCERLGGPSITSS